MTSLSDLTSWSSDWTSVSALVVGLDARSFSVVDTLVELGAAVIVVTDDEASEFARLVPVIGGELLAAADALPRVVEFSPDVVFAASESEITRWARGAGIPFWSDVDLAWRVRDKVRVADWLSVAGTEGTVTTVDLAVHVLAAAGNRVAGVGSDNVPVLDAIRNPEGFDVLVVEFTEADLASLGDTAISPLASVCVIAGDANLGRVYANTRVACIYNKADEATMHFVEEAEVVDGCRAIGFDLGTPGPSDLGLVGDIVVDRAFHEDRRTAALELTTHGELMAVGLGTSAGVISVLAASALVRAVGVEPAAIRDAIATFGSTTR